MNFLDSAALMELSFNMIVLLIKDVRKWKKHRGKMIKGWRILEMG